MKVELKMNDNSVQAEISEGQLKELGLVEQLKKLGLLEERSRTGYERGEVEETYYLVDVDDEITNMKHNGQLDRDCYDVGNYYSNKTIAENNARADRLQRCLRQWQAANDKVISISDWKNDEINKYFITYNYRSSLFEIGRSPQRREPNIIYFTTKGKVTEAIKNFRNELEWYFSEYQQRLDEEQGE